MQAPKILAVLLAVCSIAAGQSSWFLTIDGQVQGSSSGGGGTVVPADLLKSISLAPGAIAGYVLRTSGGAGGTNYWALLSGLTNLQPNVTLGTNFAILGDISVGKRVAATSLVHNVGINYGLMLERTNYMTWRTIADVSGVNPALPAAASRSFILWAQNQYGYICGGTDYIQVGQKFQMTGSNPQLKFQATATGHDDWWIDVTADNWVLKQYIGDAILTNRLVAYGKGHGVPVEWDWRAGNLTNITSVSATTLSAQGTIYIFGNATANQSWRLWHNPVTTNVAIQVRIAGVWTNAVEFTRPPTP